MLKEYTAQDSPKRKDRLWFSDAAMDLIIWLGEKNDITGFQLCYGKMENEFALTWTSKEGYTHLRVDPGENSPNKNDSPILTASGHFLKEKVLKDFKSRCKEVDYGICEFVIQKIHDYKQSK